MSLKLNAKSLCVIRRTSYLRYVIENCDTALETMILQLMIVCMVSYIRIADHQGGQVDFNLTAFPVLVDF